MESESTTHLDWEKSCSVRLSRDASIEQGYLNSILGPRSRQFPSLAFVMGTRGRVEDPQNADGTVLIDATGSEKGGRPDKMDEWSPLLAAAEPYFTQNKVQPQTKSGCLHTTGKTPVIPTRRLVQGM